MSCVVCVLCVSFVCAGCCPGFNAYKGWDPGTCLLAVPNGFFCSSATTHLCLTEFFWLLVRATTVTGLGTPNFDFLTKLVKELP